MEKQDFEHHVRYYVPHHFVLYPLLFVLLCLSGYMIYKNGNDTLTWTLFAISTAISCWISYMMRQHYALTLQNRIVRLEMRFRFFQLTGKSFEPIEKELSFGQIAALRFSSDEELPALIKRTMQENLPPATIKKQISNWKADHNRV